MKAVNIIQEAHVLSAPMIVEHKHLVLRHFHRLQKILEEADEEAIGGYTSKQAAREQLARMTVVFRDYEAKARNGEIDEIVESMVSDVVDASLFVGGRRGTYHQPVFSNFLQMGREQEVAALMQEFEAENADDVIELWNAAPKTQKVLPDFSVVNNIAADIDWTRQLLRSKSESNILHYRQRHITVKDRPRFTQNLSARNLGNWDSMWPPKDTGREPSVLRQRAYNRASDSDEWDWLN